MISWLCWRVRSAFAVQIIVTVLTAQPAPAQSVNGMTHADDVTDLEAERAVQSAIPYLRRLGFDAGGYLARVWRDGGRLRVGMIDRQRFIDVQCWDGLPDMAFTLDPTTFAVLSGGLFRPKECEPLPKSDR